MASNTGYHLIFAVAALGSRADPCVGHCLQPQFWGHVCNAGANLVTARRRKTSKRNPVIGEVLGTPGLGS